MRPQTRTALFAGYTLGVLVLNADVVRGLRQAAAADPSMSHVVLVPFLALVLGWRLRAGISAAARCSWIAGGAVILCAFVLLLSLRRAADVELPTLPLFTTGVIVSCVGGFLLFYGPTAAWVARFPLVFLAFAVPMPGVLLNGIVRVLTAGSAEMVSALMWLSGTPFHREAFTFALPNLTIQIADECSGIRSTIALFLTSLLAGHLHFNRPWTTVLLMAAVVPITIVKNAVRIVTLSLLTIHTDPGFMQGHLHRDGGVLFFLLGLAALLPVFVWLRRTERSGPLRNPLRQPIDTTSGREGIHE